MVKHGNRGKFLETMVNNTNKLYKLKRIAVVDKIATPINYNTRTNKAFYEGKSTVDFIGCLKGGRMIAFDAKQTKQKSLPFKNVGEHQEEYLRRVSGLGGIAFLLVYFETENVYYRLDIGDYVAFKNSTDRKSIPLAWFKDNCFELKSVNGYPIHYLEYI